MSLLRLMLTFCIVVPITLAETPRPQLAQSFGKLPLSFEANRGQTDGRVRYLSRGNGYTLFLTGSAAVLELRNGTPRARLSPQSDSGKQLNPAVLRMRLTGANTRPEVVGLEELPGKSNYFLGKDPAQWRTNVPAYAKVRYKDVYPGVDLVYYGNQRQLEYDFIIAPGANPKAIRLVIDGADKLNVDETGDLILHVRSGEVRFHKPAIYQQIDGLRREIAGGYKIRRANRVGFEVAGYDATRRLVIDPVLVYSTYLGGGVYNDFGSGIGVDAAGNIYVVGTGQEGAFVAKLSPAGALLYSTFLSGGQGVGIAVDSAGNAYVTGITFTSDFPTTPGAFQTSASAIGGAFVTKLNPTGSALLYSTYLAGSKGGLLLGREAGHAIAVDSVGNAYITGLAVHPDFPTVNPLQADFGGRYDAFVSKLNAAGSALVYSTYLGGSYLDQGFGIAVDPAGNAYVTGHTQSSNFPLVNPFQPVLGAEFNLTAFLVKLNPAGTALLYSTYLGNGEGRGTAVAADGAGNAYVTGFTFPGNFPTTPGALLTSAPYGGGFVSKFNSTGSLVYSTYLPASSKEALSAAGMGIVVDNAGNAYVTGQANWTGLPVVNPLQARCGDGTYQYCTNAFVTKLNAAGSAVFFSTYLGGRSGAGDSGAGIAIDAVGNIYVTGSAYSTDFPTTAPVQPTNGGSFDAFVARISPADAPGAAFGPGALVFGVEGVLGTSAPRTITLTAAGSSPLNIASIVGSGDFAQTNTCGTQLAGGAACTIDVTFTPTAVGTRTGSITVTDNASGSPHTIMLTGTGIIPAVNSGGVVNAASFAQGQAMVAGSIGSIFGTDLGSPIVGSIPIPLPTDLNGTRVTISTAAGSFSAPLFFVSTLQINFQVPWELAGQSQATVTVSVNGAKSNTMIVPIANIAPGLFSMNSQGNGPGAILIANTGTFALPPGTVPFRSSRPASRGDFISIFCTGLGALTRTPPADGAPPGETLFNIAAAAAVSIGGVAATPSFAGLAPFFAGLYQVDVQVPASVQPGSSVPIFLIVGGVSSNTVTMAVQ